MALKVKTTGKVLIFILAFALFFLGKHFLFDSELLFKKDVKQSMNIQQVVLPNAPLTQSGQNVSMLPIPTENPASVNATLVTIEAMAWNAQMGLCYANGGPKTTKGSIMEKYGVNLLIKRQDDCGQMANNLIAFAKD